MVSEFIKDKEVNPNFKPNRRKVIRMEEMSIEERDALIKKDPKFGRIVCRCEAVSEGEILDCIRRNCGATTIKGVKRRCRPGMGRCQGGFCQAIVLDILAKELNKNPEDIMYSNANSYIVLGPTKEGK